ncbi:hypothetical protein I6N90_07355 [Paenibacillus sp. GSMTC-2017]|uniref:hypothetical protein n=1 Tax=Paenibacillus sp. GSMTC-2017 TaxID=2794350 RepID=UPI0018D7129F|nr:hypothetical protein [Paenibacillus sp. GSMTC-2017]MBH5317618.1 hypothetical protein [Paenibacillus sp. GSMTC-2017]
MNISCIKKLNTFIALIVFLLLISGCTTTSNSKLTIQEVILPYYCNGIVNEIAGVKYTYLPEKSEDNYKITIKFNKELSNKNEMNLYYIQSGSPVPVLSTITSLPIGTNFDQYRISGTSIEIGYNGFDKSKPYVNPMLFSSLYLPKELMSTDGTTLGQDHSIIFSLGSFNPHEQLEQINTPLNESLTPTVILPMLSEQESLWNSHAHPLRKIGYVRNTYSPIYSNKDLSEIIDRISFGANVELTESGNGYYLVNYYVPRDLSDKKHHSNHSLSNDLDIFGSDYLIKRQGYIKAEEIGLIEPFNNQGARITVFATGNHTLNGTLELYVSYNLYGFGGSKYRLYNVQDKTEIISNDIIKKINQEQIDALEYSSYLSRSDIYGNGGTVLLDENNKEIEMDDMRNHVIMLSYLKDDRASVMKWMDIYNQDLNGSWNQSIKKSDNKYKTALDSIFETQRKINDIWYEWSGKDPQVKRETYVELFVDKFSSNDTETKKLANYFADQNISLFDSKIKFLGDEFNHTIDLSNLSTELEQSFKFPDQ